MAPGGQGACGSVLCSRCLRRHRTGGPGRAGPGRAGPFIGAVTAQAQSARRRGREACRRARAPMPPPPAVCAAVYVLRGFRVAIRVAMRPMAPPHFARAGGRERRHEPMWRRRQQPAGRPPPPPPPPAPRKSRAEAAAEGADRVPSESLPCLHYPSWGLGFRISHCRTGLQSPTGGRPAGKPAGNWRPAGRAPRRLHALSVSLTPPLPATPLSAFSLSFSSAFSLVPAGRPHALRPQTA